MGEVFDGPIEPQETGSDDRMYRLPSNAFDGGAFANTTTQATLAAEASDYIDIRVPAYIPPLLLIMDRVMGDDGLADQADTADSLQETDDDEASRVHEADHLSTLTHTTGTVVVTTTDRGDQLSLNTTADEHVITEGDSPTKEHQDHEDQQPPEATQVARLGDHALGARNTDNRPGADLRDEADHQTAKRADKPEAPPTDDRRADRSEQRSLGEHAVAGKLASDYDATEARSDHHGRPEHADRQVERKSTRSATIQCGTVEQYQARVALAEHLEHASQRWWNPFDAIPAQIQYNLGGHRAFLAAHRDPRVLMTF